MARKSSHTIETNSRDYIRSFIDGYFDNGDALFRDLAERDYGIDGIVGLFDKGKLLAKLLLSK